MQRAHVLLASALWVLGACAEVEHETGVTIVSGVPPALAGAVHEAAVRLWDTEQRLVLDGLVALDAGATELPFTVPVQPRNDADGRFYRVEIDLLDTDGCPVGRGSTRGTFEAGSAPVRAVTITPTGLAPCNAVYVDGRTPDTADDPAACADRATPCHSIEYALTTYFQAGMTNIVYVQGGVTYTRPGPTTNGVLNLRVATSGTASTPTIVRAWPGTSVAVAADGTRTLTMPRLDANREHYNAVDGCCGENGPQFTILDGLELVGGLENGLQLNSSGTDDNVARNCWIHDNGISPPTDLYFYGGIKIANDAARNTIEHCVIENNGIGVAGRGIFVHSRGTGVSTGVVLRFNRVLRNTAEGIVMGSDDGIVEGNQVCGNEAAGIRVTAARPQIIGNTAVRNAHSGIALTGDAMATSVRDNVLAFNEGYGIDDGGSATMASYDLFFGNVQGPGLDPGATDLVSDPLLGTECDLAPRRGSPVFGAASDGGDLGAYEVR